MLKTFTLVFLAAFIGVAVAADNSVILTPGTGVTMRTKDVGGGVESSLTIPGDTAGNALATVPGTPNAAFALPVQGVTGGTAVPISGAITNAGTFAVQLNATPSLVNGNGVVQTQGGAVLSATNGVFSNILQGNAVLSATNGLFSNVLQGNAVLSATNGLYSNILQGNAAISATNGLYNNLLQGNAVLSNTNPIPTNPVPVTTGGLTTFFVQPAASDNHTNIKNGAGQVYWVLAENNSSTVNYLRLYNAATGFNGCGSATNLVSQIQIPANTAVGGINIALPFGIPFSTGISICVTSGYATTDATNATASAISLTIGYN